MATYIQADRPIKISSPALGPDDLLLVGFRGNEEISQLFYFELDLLANNHADIPFDKLLGESITISLAMINGKKRYFNGICRRLSQGPRDHTFTSYRMEVVPRLWLLTKIRRCRIFQQRTIPDILLQLFAGMDVKPEIHGPFFPRDYCVQYQESDYAFASRLMEEEGIYYFFKHTDKTHTMVLGNTPQSHPDVPEFNKVIWEDITGGLRSDYRIHRWEKSQELRSGLFTLWDNCFEMPDKHLEAMQPIDAEVQAGKVKHKLKLGVVDGLEIYEYPGEYAQRFDGVDPGGGDRAADLVKIFEENKRTVGIRMQEETVPALTIKGEGLCRNFTSGHKFQLERHFNADGEYLLTGVDHVALLGSNYRSGETEEFTYENRFACIPFAMPYRPTRQTPRPRIHGTQTAIVVGPKGEEIFTDKYGRIKVQFPWDREGRYDEASSCWIRVATSIAGAQWGSVYIPRIGQEVVVAFEEGDPDRPIVMGSVYNFATMPPYKLPDEKTKTVFLKSDSSPHKPGFNEIRFEDKKEDEDFFMHAEKDMDIRVKNDRREFIGHDRHLITTRDKIEETGGNRHGNTKGESRERIGGNSDILIGGDVRYQVLKGHSTKVQNNMAVEVFGNQSDRTHGRYGHETQGLHFIGSHEEICLWTPGGFILMNQDGIRITGTRVLINCGGEVPTCRTFNGMDAREPAAAHIALNADPGDKSPTYKNQLAAMTAAQLAIANAPRHDPNAEENKDKKSWIDIELIDEEGNPVPGTPYRITLPDGSTIASGALDLNGRAHISNIDPGNCKVTFPELDKEAWKTL